MQRYRLQDFTLCRGEEAPIACRVPCSAQGVLTRAGVLADPFFGHQLDAATEAVASGCRFVCTVHPTAEWLTGAPVRLTLRDVREACEVLVNGHAVGRLSRTYEIGTYDIAPLLHEGDNELCLSFAPRSTGGEMYYLNDGTHLPATFDPAIGFAEIEVLSGPSITHVTARPVLRDGHGHVHIQAELFGVRGKAKVVATLTARDGKMYYAGLPGGEGELYVADPSLWHMGDDSEKHVYRLSLTLYRDDEPADEYTTSLGFADLQVEGVAAHGRKDMLVSLNGERVLLKGCRYTVPALYPSETDAEKEEAWVRLMIDAGFNLLCVPSNSPFPSESLLDACDRFGVAVWRELPPAPTDAQAQAVFLDAMRRQIRRMSAHVCLLFVTASTPCISGELLSILHEEAPTVHGFACGEAARSLTCAVLTDVTDGAELDGILVCHPPHALPTFASICDFAGEDANLYGRTVEYHTQGTDVPSVFLQAAERYAFPACREAAVYVTDRMLMDAVVTHNEKARCAYPATSGILLPDLFDLVPTASSAPVDAYGRRRAAFYGVRRALSPVLLVPERSGYRITFRVHNDRKTPYVGTLQYRIADRNNHVILSAEVPAHIDAHSVATVETADFSTRVFRHESEYYLSAWLDDGRAITSHTVCLFTEPKHFSYAPPCIRTEVTGSGGDFEIRLHASVFVHGAYLSFGDIAATTDGNLVDLTADIPVKLRVRTPRGVTADDLSHALRIVSVNHIGCARTDGLDT